MRERTRPALPPFVLLAAPAAVVAALMSATAAFATPLPSQAGSTAPPAPQIIMRDGGVCDPIRHMGC